MDAFTAIKNQGILPFLNLTDPSASQNTAQALSRGGIPLLELSFQETGAIECLRAIKANVPDMLVGVGMVQSCQQADQAKEAEADFITIPDFRAEIVRHCLIVGLPVIPTCTESADIETALSLGLDVISYFPSKEQDNSPEQIRRLCKAYPNAQFVLGGEMTLSNIASYLALDGIAAVRGDFMAPPSLMETQDWAGVTALSEKAVQESLGFSLAHIGINSADQAQGMSTAQWFAERFGFPVKPGEKSNFAGTYVECCNQKFPGKYGHIGIFTISPERALAYFNAKGILIRQEFRNIGPDGKLVAAYLKEEVGGFAVHIVKKPSE